MNPTAHIQLKDPDFLAMQNAYRSLPKRGEVTIKTVQKELASMLEMLEETGFAGMTVSPLSDSDQWITIRACKGKQGACYDAGRTARYLGVALAALDDDHHLLFAGEEVPVCEKTATLYHMSTYRGLIRCSEPDPELHKKLQADPEPFDCDNFEELQEKLFSMVQGKEAGDERTGLFYPGPFKVLVLKDGTLLYRGRVNQVPVKAAKQLTKSDGLFPVTWLESHPYASFSVLYQAEGPRCLLGKVQAGKVRVTHATQDFGLLGRISPDLRKRLIHAIETGKDYFMLTGSNKEDNYGCCPSDEVTEADRLVKAGILSASREQAGIDSCPVTLYAFINELNISEGELRFSRNEAFRDQILHRLKHDPGRNFRFIARWVLLAFVAISIVLAITRLKEIPDYSTQNELYEQLDISRPNSTVLILFHYNQRCAQCLAMERLSLEVLEGEFRREFQQKSIDFRQVVIDRSENRKLVERFGIITSTLVIINFKEREEINAKVLNRSWVLYENEPEFKKMLISEINQVKQDLP